VAWSLGKADQSETLTGQFTCESHLAVEFEKQTARQFGPEVFEFRVAEGSEMHPKHRGKLCSFVGRGLSNPLWFCRLLGLFEAPLELLIGQPEGRVQDS